VVLLSENRQIATLVLITFFLGVLAVGAAVVLPPLFEGDLVVDDYQAVFYENGTLVERYTYDVQVSGEYRMLFRYFDDTLTFVDTASPHIRYLGMDVPEGVIGYAKDYSGGIVVVPDATESEKEFIRGSAYANELGIYNPAYFDEGTYTVEYRFAVVPPIEYDSENTHLNLKLVREHIPYRHLSITLPAWTGIEKVYAYPPGLDVAEDGTTVTITGSAAENDVVAVELLLDAGAKDRLNGVPSQVDDLKGKTESAAFWYNLPYSAAFALYVLAAALVLLLPFVFLFVYVRWGREKAFTVPEYLSVTPNNTLRPWQVNLLFKGDVIDFDENGFYATVLDLHRKGALTVKEKPEGKGVLITVNRQTSDDAYEQRVLTYLSNLTEGKTFDTATVEALSARAAHDKAAETAIMRFQGGLKALQSSVDASLSRK